MINTRVRARLERLAGRERQRATGCVVVPRDVPQPPALASALPLALLFLSRFYRASNRFASVVRVGNHKWLGEDVGLVIPMKCEREARASSTPNPFFFELFTTNFNGLISLHFTVDNVTDTVFRTPVPWRDSLPLLNFRVPQLHSARIENRPAQISRRVLNQF